MWQPLPDADDLGASPRDAIAEEACGAEEQRGHPRGSDRPLRVAAAGVVCTLVALLVSRGPAATWWRPSASRGAGSVTSMAAQGFFSEAPREGAARVVETAKGSGSHLQELPDVVLEFDDGLWTATVVEVDVDDLDQELLGFGGAFTEAASSVFSGLEGYLQDDLLNKYFGPDGLGYTLGRVHINSCDFSLEGYSFDDREDDWELEDFDDSVEHDMQNSLIPLISAAQDKLQEQGRQLKLLASPWSPPAWMKTSGKMDQSGDPGLRDECRAVWARYISRWISAYEARGVPVWAVTVQNEPGQSSAFESCRFTAEQEADFLAEQLGPRLRAEHPGVKIFIYDHNKESLVDFTRTVLGRPSAEQFVDGVAFHWYTGDHFEQVAQLHGELPKSLLLASEATYDVWGGKDDRDPWEFGEGYAHDILGDLNAGAAGWIDWNLLLDERGGPNHVGNTCEAAIKAGPGGGSLELRPQYYFVAHFSKFIPPGSRRLGTKVRGNEAREDRAKPYYGTCGADGGLEATAWQRDDGQVAVVVLNCGDGAVQFRLRRGRESALTSIPPHAIQTYLMPLRERESSLCGEDCGPGYEPRGCRCEPVPCPAHTEGGDVPDGCLCAKGYSGRVESTTVPPFFGGGCYPEPCPANSEGRSVGDGCTCAAGYRGSLEASREPPFFHGECLPEPCPAGSEGASLAAGCSCRAGFLGGVAPAVGEPFYSGVCVPVPCPANSESASGSVADGGCSCSAGYTGGIEPSTAEPYFVGECELVAAESSFAA